MMKRFLVVFVVFMCVNVLFSIENCMSFPDPLQAINPALRDYQMDNSISYSWNNGWNPSTKTEYLYTDANQTSQVLTKVWNTGVWVNSTKAVYSYDAQSQISEIITYRYESFTWVNQQKTVYSYNSIGISNIYIYQWNTNSWTPYFRTIYQYGPGSNIYILNGEQYTDGLWVPFYEYTYSYNLINQVTELHMRLWPNGTDMYSYRYVYSYGANLMVSQSILQQIVNVTFWQNVGKTIYTYDTNSNQTEALFQSWNTTSSTWHDLSVQYSSYDNNNCKILDLNQVIQDNTWINTSKIDYVYNFVGLEDMVIPTAITALKCYPNPFSAQVTIDVKGISSPLCVYNQRGQLVATLSSKDGSLITWNGRDHRGVPLANGIYLIKAKSGDKAISSKVLLVR